MKRAKRHIVGQHRSMQFVDITGQKYGRLTAAWPVGYTPDRKVLWLCFCDCGEMRLVAAKHLRSGYISTCMPEGRAKVGQRHVTHGHTRGRQFTGTYSSWAAMIARCKNPSNAKWKYYGGRGIRVCRRWLKFENFLADIGERPEGLTLERIENEKNYTPSNCKWATRKEQSQNRRKTAGK